MSHEPRIEQAQKLRTPWNKGKSTGPKPPLKMREIWAIRIRLQLAGRLRDLALFNLAIDSKLRGCDLVELRVRDVAHGGRVAHRAKFPGAEPITALGDFAFFRLEITGGRLVSGFGGAINLDRS